MNGARVRSAFRTQATVCEAMGSALTGRVLGLCAERLRGDTATGARVLNWPGKPGGGDDALALRLAAGLHRLVLDGADRDLVAAYAAHPEIGDEALWVAIAAALGQHDANLAAGLNSAPQTNEVRRSAVLIAAAGWLAERVGLPLVLSELGASAGLNLLWDRYRLEAGGKRLGPATAGVVLTPEWRGRPPPSRLPVVAERAGADLNPLDPVADRTRILSYIWPDQPDRISRTERALDVAAQLRPRIVRGDAVDWLQTRLAGHFAGRLHLVFHTVAWQYFPALAQARGEQLLAQAGARATTDAPLARLAFEADDQGPGAAITVQLWPGGEMRSLGRADFHARWIDWQAGT